MTDFIRNGDRVQITFRDGTEIRGRVLLTPDESPHWHIEDDEGLTHYVMSYERMTKLRSEITWTKQGQL